MELIASIHSVQPFWIWLALGVLLLAVEAAFSTEWLLWPAVAAGAVAALSVLGVRLGVGGEIAVFGAVTLVLTLVSRRLIKKVNPAEHPDINDRHGRLVGQRAEVVQPFAAGRGRVFVSGAEWAAELEGEGVAVGDSVVVAAVDGPRLKVRPV